MPKNRKPPSKSAIVAKLLAREKGASIAEMTKATGWQDHSIRAYLTGVRRKHTLTKEERSDGTTRYRLIKVAPEPAAAEPTP